jgi:DNA-binding response OmpR family regulator
MQKVLLIEDNEDVRENTAEILRLANYEVAIAENGKRGIITAFEFLPDIVICDIMMPEMDGYEVLRQLNKNASTAGVPFIFLTAKTSRADVREGMNLGADDYLTKPFEEKELLDAIQSRLEKHDFLRREIAKNLSGINKFLEGATHHIDLESLTKSHDVKKFAKNEIVFWEGDGAHALYFVESGTLKTYVGTESGKEFVTGIYSAGDFVGQLSLLNSDGRYIETAKVVEDAELCAIPKEEFTDLLFSNQVVSQQFIAMMSANLINVQEHLVDMAYASVRQRAAKALLQLFEKGIVQDRANNGVGIPREDFAGMIGTATETAIRTLSDFKDEGLITTDQGRKIILKDKEALKKVAQFS